MFIERDENFRNDVVSHIDNMQFDIYTSPNGLNAFESAYFIKPDLIICNESMPCMYNKSFIEYIHSMPGEKNPVFLFSAPNKADVMQKAIDAGIDKLKTKPLSFYQLFNGIRMGAFQELALTLSPQKINNNYTYQFEEIDLDHMGISKLNLNKTNFSFTCLNEIKENISQSNTHLASVTNPMYQKLPNNQLNTTTNTGNELHCIVQLLHKTNQSKSAAFILYMQCISKKIALKMITFQ